MIPEPKNTNSESDNTSSEVMNTSPAHRNNGQLVESVSNQLVDFSKQIKKVKSRMIDTSHLFKMLRNAKDKVSTQTDLIERLEAEQAETKASLDAMEQENAKMSQELEEIKRSMLSQESLDSYEDKITKFEADIAKLTQELTSKNMYAEQLEASNSALQTQWDQRKSEFNANKASEKHRQELNKKNENIKELQAKLKEMEDKNTQLQEEVTRLDDENMVLNINKDLDEESDSDDESTDDEQEDTSNERVKQLEERYKQCLAEKNAVENHNKESAIKNKALEERVVALETIESVNDQLVIDNRNLLNEINTLKTKYDAVCEQQRKQVKERRFIGLTPSPSPSHIEKSVPKVVHDKLFKLKAENIYLKSSCKALKKQVYKTLQNMSIDELIATEPSASSDESSEDESSTSKTNYTNPITKRSTGRNPSNDLLITAPKHAATAVAPHSNHNNNSNTSSYHSNNTASPTLYRNNNAASPSSYHNNSIAFQSSYHNNNAASPPSHHSNNAALFTVLPLIDSTPTHRRSCSSPESNVEELLPGPSFRRSSNTSRSIKSNSSTADQSGIISPHLLNKELNTKTTGPSVPRNSPTIGFNGLIIPPSTVSKPTSTAATKRTTLKPKGSKPSSKLLKFVNSKNPSRYITSATNVVPISSVSKVPSSPPNPKNTTGASSPAGSIPNNNSNTEAESSNINHSPSQNQLQRLTNSGIDTVILEQAPTSLQSKKCSSIDTNHTDIQDRPAADDQEAKKRKIEYPISRTIDQMIKSKKINEIDSADFKDIDKCIAEISECYRRMKSIPCPEISDINSFGIPGEFTINAPNRWDKREKSYAWYLSLLSRKKEFYDYILNRILIAFRAELRTKKMESYNARWMRLICMVLKSKNDMRQMMATLRELACRKNCQYHLFISVVNLIVGWKECVVDPCHNQVQSQTLQVCIAYIAKSNKTPPNAASIYSKIAPLVNWPTLETTVTMESLVDSDMLVIKEKLPTYKSSGNEDSFMRARAVAVRSLEMVFTTIDDWKSTFNEFLLTRVWPLLSDPIIGEVAVELLGTLGKLGVSDDVLVADKQGVETLLNILKQCLDFKATTDAEKSLVKFAAVGCLKLGARDPRCEAIVKANNL